MLISDSTARAFDAVAARERDLLNVFTPGAVMENGGATSPEAADRSLDPLSVAPPPDTYFVTRAEGGGLLYTRDGSFALQNGTLVDSTGTPLLGRSATAASLQPLSINAIDFALGLAHSVQVQADGSLTYERQTIDPRTGFRQAQQIRVGRLTCARFPAGTRLSPADAIHIAAPPGIAPHFGSPGDGNFLPLQTFARERSGVGLDAGLERLQEAYLTLDALRAAGAAHSHIEKTAMDLLT